MPSTSLQNLSNIIKHDISRGMLREKAITGIIQNLLTPSHIKNLDAAKTYLYKPVVQNLLSFTIPNTILSKYIQKAIIQNKKGLATSLILADIAHKGIMLPKIIPPENKFITATSIINPLGVLYSLHKETPKTRLGEMLQRLKEKYILMRQMPKNTKAVFLDNYPGIGSFAVPRTGFLSLDIIARALDGGTAAYHVLLQGKPRKALETIKTIYNAPLNKNLVVTGKSTPLSIALHEYGHIKNFQHPLGKTKFISDMFLNAGQNMAGKRKNLTLLSKLEALQSGIQSVEEAAASLRSFPYLSTADRLNLLNAWSTYANSAYNDYRYSKLVSKAYNTLNRTRGKYQTPYSPSNTQ